MHEIKLGRNTRMSFSKIKDELEMPNLLEVQKNSYQWFLNEGLREVFSDISKITDFTGNLVLRFIDHSLDSTPKYTELEAKERDTTYAAPLRVKVQLENMETGEIKEQEIFMGDFPLMTDNGTFIINGAERVVVNQLVRSPGIYYTMQYDKNGKALFNNTVIPNRGAWLEYETDSNDIVSVRVDRTRKVPITVFLRAMGLGSNQQITELFGETEQILATLTKDNCNNENDGLVEVYKRLRPGEPPTVESASSLLNSLFFDPKRYDLAKVGRYTFNKKLNIKNRVMGHVAAEDIVSPITGEIIVKSGAVISKEDAHNIFMEDVNRVTLLIDGRDIVVFSNNFVHIENYIDFDLGFDINSRVYKPVLDELIEKYGDNEYELKQAIKDNLGELVPKHIKLDDIFGSVNYQFGLPYGVGVTDDIDHLGNRRLRSVGELLQNQFRIGLSRMERVIRERMVVQDLDVVTPQTLINIRPVSAAIKEFFGSSQLSQFMDQPNPLAELGHKRRLSALGPGGLSRDRASFEVRDVHHTHYSRMCPIETPEGPNVGLISQLATFARVNEYGFIEAPYRRVDKEKKVVTNEVHYMTADVEDAYVVAQANEPLDENDWFAHKNVTARYMDKIREYEANSVDYMDVSPRQLVSVATAMIPFLENDDVTRALMGSNMQRQAVPLLKTDSPIIGTGMEYKAALDSGVCLRARNAGEVIKVSADEVFIRRTTGGIDKYKLIKFARSNQGTCINQRPIVSKGDIVEAGEIICDGPSTDTGEISLGRNCLMGFVAWEGYNYEDAILINERLLKEDTFTSIHIEEYSCDSRDTKLGQEEITREIPNVGEDALRELDERGIIRVGAEVRSGDLLVGKITPKGETELTSEEKLLRAIFGEKAREVRDTSLRVPHGESGIVVDVKVFTRTNGDELPPGVNQVVLVYIAQKRKISVGDKMAGRHGNKGVISRILPDEDMPFLPDGTTLDVVLNPLGVHSRMNIGQVLEVHLGYAAKALGYKVATPVFDGATEVDIAEKLTEAGYNPDGKSVLYDGRTGEPFDDRVTVGYMYILKLLHLVDDKIHARSTGPYSLVTQQPLGGKAQFGGQRFGEMEVWALEAYGAAYTLQEILTVKSDDIVGRVKTYEAIVKGESIPQPGIPESFKVLIKELQSLALDVKVLDENGDEIKLSETRHDDSDYVLNDKHKLLDKYTGADESDYVTVIDENEINESDLIIEDVLGTTDDFNIDDEFDIDKLTGIDGDKEDFGDEEIF